MQPLDLTVLLLSLNEEENLRYLLPKIADELRELNISSEIVIVDGGSSDNTREVAEQFGAKFIVQPERGYGNALRLGLSSAQGRRIVTLDADGSHPPGRIEDLWNSRAAADLIICSRMIPGGSTGGIWIRQKLSKILSLTLPTLLKIPVKDISSGYRIYEKSTLDQITLTSSGFEILIELLVKLYAAGYSLAEIPLQYEPRITGKSHVSLISFGLAYLAAAVKMKRLRNSIESADYDSRAYDSKIPLQRYWQRKRYSLVKGFLGTNPGQILDVGCGSSRIIQSLPNAVAADFSFTKLRFLKRTNKYRVQLSSFELPFRASSFDSAIHSQVIEHIPFDEKLFSELARVIKPGGNLIIGTPDYGRIWWPITEFFYSLLLPGAYAHEHITHYTADSLKKNLEDHGFKVIERAYICGGELIYKCLRQ